MPSGFLEEEDERRRWVRQKAEEQEVVRVSRERGLLPKKCIKDLRSLLRRAPRSLMRGQPVLNGGELLDRPGCLSEKCPTKAA